MEKYQLLKDDKYILPILGKTVCDKYGGFSKPQYLFQGHFLIPQKPKPISRYDIKFSSFSASKTSIKTRSVAYTNPSNLILQTNPSNTLYIASVSLQDLSPPLNWWILPPTSTQFFPQISFRTLLIFIDSLTLSATSQFFNEQYIFHNKT